MLNLLEGFDVAGLGYGTADGIHLLAEVLKIAFADRETATGDPAFVDVPVERLIAKDYAAARRGEIDMQRAGRFGSAVGVEAEHTTHVTVADADLILVLDGGRIVERGSFRDLVAANGLFARLVAEGGFIEPETKPEGVEAVA